jgi:cytochrome c-type biogenesis protein CcmE
MNKKKLITGIIIIASASGYLLYLAGNNAFVYYYSVDELSRDNLLNQIKQSPQSIRIAGTVKNIEHITLNNSRQVEFELSGSDNNIKVTYKKRLPDNFKENRKVVVQGKNFIDGKFAAGKIITKCESKYKSKLENEGKFDQPAN